MLCVPVYNNLNVNTLHSLYFVVSLVLHPDLFFFFLNSICTSPETSAVPLSIENCPSGADMGVV